MHGCLTVVFTEQLHDEAFLGGLRASVTQNAYALRDVIAGTSDLAGVPLEQVLSFATVQARLRIPQKSMQRSYRVSFYVQWQLWSTAMSDVRRGRAGWSARRPSRPC